MSKILALVFVISCSAYAFGQKGDTLYYDKQPTITWKDFKEIPDLSNDSLKAFLSVAIQMRLLKINVWMGYGTYDAHAIVYRNASWVKQGIQDTLILRHLQYAFALNELIASKLKQQVNDSKINLRWKNKIDKIFNKYDLYSKQCLNAYYTETENGQNKQKQAEWEAMIDRNQIKLEMADNK